MYSTPSGRYTVPLLGKTGSLTMYCTCWRADRPLCLKWSVQLATCIHINTFRSNSPQPCLLAMEVIVLPFVHKYFVGRLPSYLFPPSLSLLPLIHWTTCLCHIQVWYQWGRSTTIIRSLDTRPLSWVLHSETLTRFWLWLDAIIWPFRECWVLGHCENNGIREEVREGWGPM